MCIDFVSLHVFIRKIKCIVCGIVQRINYTACILSFWIVLYCIFLRTSFNIVRTHQKCAFRHSFCFFPRCRVLRGPREVGVCASWIPTITAVIGLPWPMICTHLTNKMVGIYLIVILITFVLFDMTSFSLILFKIHIKYLIKINRIYFSINAWVNKVLHKGTAKEHWSSQCWSGSCASLSNLYLMGYKVFYKHLNYESGHSGNRHLIEMSLIYFFQRKTVKCKGTVHQIKVSLWKIKFPDRPLKKISDSMQSIIKENPISQS